MQSPAQYGSPKMLQHRSPDVQQWLPQTLLGAQQIALPPPFVQVIPLAQQIAVGVPAHAWLGQQSSPPAWVQKTLPLLSVGQQVLPQHLLPGGQQVPPQTADWQHWPLTIWPFGQHALLRQVDPLGQQFTLQT
jgi:hypothetical protein